MTKEEYEKKAKELLKSVPKQYREGCKKYAYNQGHAYGYTEMYNVLLDIEEIFNP